MGRLYRPHIPLSVRVEVAERQLRDLGEIKGVIAVGGPRTSENKLRTLLPWLARVLLCELSELRLDHDPPLGARPKIVEGRKMIYSPDANDPIYLQYRPHGPEHDGSHLIKTNVRGDHGQHPDRVLIKKQRRIERGPKPKRGPKIQSRGFGNVSRPFSRRSK
jgi:hypothetical protein